MEIILYGLFFITGYLFPQRNSFMYCRMGVSVTIYKRRH